MKKLILLLFITPLFVFAQNNPNWEYWQINRWEAKDGMAKEFESAQWLQVDLHQLKF